MYIIMIFYDVILFMIYFEIMSTCTWKGWYAYGPSNQHHGMLFDELVLEDGKIRGKGRDDVGEFDISGYYMYVFSSNINKVHFSKKYKGRHTVQYAGTREGDVINGQWTLGPSQGAFQLSKQENNKWECYNKTSGDGMDEVSKFTLLIQVCVWDDRY